MSKAVKERKELKRNTGNGIEVRRRFSLIDAKVEAQRKADPSYDVRRELQLNSFTKSLGGIYDL